MPKAKIARKSTAIDMTPMVDLGFLLITFFMLTTKFRPSEAVEVTTPSSISDTKLPPTDILTLTISKEGRLFWNTDGKGVRESICDQIAKQYDINFTENERKSFAVMGDVGVPFGNLKQYLGFTPNERDKLEEPGIPYDSLNNELDDWLVFTRMANPKVRIVIKGDKDTPYPNIKRVISVLQDKNVNKFNLITGSESDPRSKK